MRAQDRSSNRISIKALRRLVPAAAAVTLAYGLTACRQGTQHTDPAAQHTQTDSTTIDLLRQAGRALEQRDLAAGLTFTDSALTRTPDNTDARFLHGRLLFEKGDYPQSEESFRVVLASRPDYPGAWLNLGNIHYSQKAYRAAVAAYLKESAANPDARAWHAAGAAYSKLGIADSALFAYRRAITLRPEYTPGHAALAEWYAAEGDYVRALQHATTAAELAPENPDYLYQKAAYLSRIDRHGEAIPILEELASRRTWDHRVFFSLGRSLQQDGRTDEAAQALDRATALQKQEAEINRLRSLSDETPSSFDRRLELAERLRTAGRLHEAVREYEVAVAQQPANVGARSNLATLYLQTGNEDAALRSFRDVLRRDSTFIEAWLNISLHHLRAGRDREAQEAFERARRIAPDHPLVKRLSGTIG